MKGIVTIIILLLSTAIGEAKQPTEVRELKDIFDKYGVNGSILIFNREANEFLGYNLARCNVGFCPASTFKIPNTLIALESGVATLDSVFKWDGLKRSVPAWEKDMTLAEAVKLSCVPVFQEIARRVGVDRMKSYVRLFNYGDMDIHAGNIDRFWLEGNSNITQYQQIYFLQKLYHLQLPVSEQSMNLVKQVLLQEDSATYRFSWKTGWAVRQTENITWLVGYLETKNNVYFFATSVEPTKDTDLTNFSQVRILLTKDIFKKLNIIKTV